MFEVSCKNTLYKFTVIIIIIIIISTMDAGTSPIIPPTQADMGIGATTVGTGGDCTGPTNFLDVVFKKQKNSQQVLTRMQDLASEFSKIFRGDTPGPSQREGATPPTPNTQPGLWPGVGRKRPVLGPKPWTPSTFRPWLHPWIWACYLFVPS